MVSLYLLQGAGGEPMAGHVDDVIGARHDVQEALLVDVAGVHGVVEALRGEPTVFCRATLSPSF